MENNLKVEGHFNNTINDDIKARIMNLDKSQLIELLGTYEKAYLIFMIFQNIDCLGSDRLQTILQSIEEVKEEGYIQAKK